MFEATIKSVNTIKMQVAGEIFGFEAIFESLEIYQDVNPIMAYKATSNLDTMYHHQAMRQPDKEEFKTAMAKELQDQMNNSNFKVMKHTKISEGT